MRLRLAIAGLVALAANAALADTPVPPPVAAVVEGRLPSEAGSLPLT